MLARQKNRFRSGLRGKLPRRMLVWLCVLAAALVIHQRRVSVAAPDQSVTAATTAALMIAQAAPVQTDSAAPDAADPTDADPTDAEPTDSEPTNPVEAASHVADHDGEHSGGGHADPVAPVLLAIVLILLLAKIGGDLFERMSMPAVLGELTIGVLLGNFLLLTGSDVFEFLDPKTSTGAIVDILARIGVVLLLFEVGLESRIREMVQVGVSSLFVAILGVVAPILLGWGVGWVIIPEAGWQVHAFLGATLCATSVGITARVLKDLGRSQQRESRIILGAAVIDDVLGLIVLAIVSGVIATGEVELYSLLKIVGLAFGFLAGALLLGAAKFPQALFRGASYLRGHGLLVVTALVICFGFAYAANLVGLAPIIGAFAAGLILDGAHYREVGKKWQNAQLEDALAPLSALLVPIFFVGMGIQVNLASFKDPSVWGLATALTIAAIIGKQVCAYGVVEKGLNKTAVGLGMIPRGEVGLIFANEGRKLVANGIPVIDDGTFSAIVVMVMVTTMITPPLLKWSLNKSDNGESPPSPNTTDANATAH